MTTVIRKPIVTEKTTWSSSMQNRYCFEIDRSASKTEVKRAIEELYGRAAQEFQGVRAWSTQAEQAIGSLGVASGAQQCAMAH